MTDNKTLTAQVRNLDMLTWRKFQAECKLRNIKPSTALKEAIENWLKTNTSIIPNTIGD